MTRFGYFLSTEEYTPSELLEQAGLAEGAGFDSLWISDHFHRGRTRRTETTDRFPRRLIAERRIRFVRVGRHVRIPVSALEEFVQQGTVDPIVITWRNGRVA